jgi:hypothetical protein
MRLVEDDRPPAPALDDDALPAGWGDWITAEALARGCPRDYVAGGLIASASAWLGNARHVAATPTWRELPHLWFAEIGPPSVGKSPALRPMVEVCQAIERDAESAWKAATAKYAGLAEGARATEEAWKRDVREAVRRGTPPPDRPSGADASPTPPRPRILAMDSTTEELQKLLAEQPRGLLYYRDELTGWLGNHDRYGGHGGDRAFFSRLGMAAPMSPTGSNTTDSRYASPTPRWRSSVACSLTSCVRPWLARMMDSPRGWLMSGPTRHRSDRCRPRLTPKPQPAAIS